ncbi:VOC family protein, partial [Leclercia adecarboxylata]|uniref:VOC family protein n=1 Tax=Leclercia adecarboxylata TaxID=83655 RepID=UPI00234D7289
FYEMLGFEKFDDQIFGEGAGVWRGLGLAENRRFRAVFMKIPGDRPVPFLDIIQFLDPPTSGEAYPSLDNVGIGRLCFEVADIDAAAAVLAAHGVTFSGPIAPYEVAPGVRPHGVEARFLCFKDPDGTILEYVQFAGEARDVVMAGAG